MQHTSRQTQNQVAPPDDGSGRHIPEACHPLHLINQLPDPHTQRQFAIAALAAYEFYGYDTPQARRQIAIEFHTLKFQTINNNRAPT